MLTSQELLRGLVGHLSAAWGYSPVDIYEHIAVDSRQVGSGDLFVALAGEHHDGHEFIGEAIARGAAGVITKQAPYLNGDKVAIFQVREPLTALQDLARRRLSNSAAKVIGVTGSVGKTTCKELVAAVLSARYCVLKSQANLNSEIGLPISLLDLKPEHDRVVLEMAMYQQGDIRFLCELSEPQIGVVTNVGPSHIERLGSLQAIADAKAELPNSLPPDGFAVLNGDDPLVSTMAERTRAGVVLYGLAQQCAMRAEEIVSHGAEGLSFVLCSGRQQAAARLRMPGRHNIHNALAAAAVGLVEGLSLREVADALSDADVPSRIRLVPGYNNSTIIDDAYNASPASVLAAIYLLKEMPGRTIAFLGDMRELGDHSYEGHRQVGLRAAQVADIIYAVGNDGKIIGQGAKEMAIPWCASSKIKQKPPKLCASGCAPAITFS